MHTAENPHHLGSISGCVHVVAPQRRVWIPWLFDGEHSFTIERIDSRSVRFTQHEDFAGIFVPFVGFEPYHQGWELMNAALKRRAEAATVDAK